MTQAAQSGTRSTAVAKPRQSRVQRRPDAAWKRLTESGNCEHRASNFVSAGWYYAQALAEARRIFGAADIGPEEVQRDAPALLVVSCHNACDNWIQSGQSGPAIALLREAVRRLCAVIESAEAPMAFRDHCFRHLSYAQRYLVSSTERAGQDIASINSDLLRAKAAGKQLLTEQTVGFSH